MNLVMLVPEEETKRGEETKIGEETRERRRDAREAKGRRPWAVFV
jgi:hypothetical protein